HYFWQGGKKGTATIFGKRGCPMPIVKRVRLRFPGFWSRRKGQPLFFWQKWMSHACCETNQAPVSWLLVPGLVKRSFSFCPSSPDPAMSASSSRRVRPVQPKGLAVISGDDNEVRFFSKAAMTCASSLLFLWRRSLRKTDRPATRLRRRYRYNSRSSPITAAPTCQAGSRFENGV